MRELLLVNGRYILQGSGAPFLGAVPRDLDVGDTYQSNIGVVVTLQVTSKTTDEDGTLNVTSKVVG